MTVGSFYWGGHALWDEGRPGIYVASDDPEFAAAVRQDLLKISSGDVGRRLLDMISLRCQGIGQKQSGDLRVNIEVSGYGEHGTDAEDHFKGGAVRQKRRGNANFRLKGCGSGVTVAYCTGPDWEKTYTEFIGVRSPTFVILAHELIHALHSLSGDNRALDDRSWNKADDAAWKYEEARTVGMSIYADNPISENAIRAEHRIQRRETYSKDPLEGLTSAIAGAPGSLNGTISSELLKRYSGL